MQFSWQNVGVCSLLLHYCTQYTHILSRKSDRIVFESAVDAGTRFDCNFSFSSFFYLSHALLCSLLYIFSRKSKSSLQQNLKTQMMFEADEEIHITFTKRNLMWRFQWQMLMYKMNTKVLFSTRDRASHFELHDSQFRQAEIESGTVSLVKWRIQAAQRLLVCHLMTMHQCGVEAVTFSSNRKSIISMTKISWH